MWVSNKYCVTSPLRPLCNPPGSCVLHVNIAVRFGAHLVVSEILLDRLFHLRTLRLCLSSASQPASAASSDILRLCQNTGEIVFNLANSLYRWSDPGRLWSNNDMDRTEQKQDVVCSSISPLNLVWVLERYENLVHLATVLLHFSQCNRSLK